MIFKSPEIVRFGSLRTTDHEQSQPWLAKRWSPPAAGTYNAHRTPSVACDMRTEQVKSIENRNGPIRATQIPTSEIVLVSGFKISERI